MLNPLDLHASITGLPSVKRFITARSDRAGSSATRVPLPEHAQRRRGTTSVRCLATIYFAAIAALSSSKLAVADLIVYEGFAYPTCAIDGRNGGTGWSTHARTLGSGGADAS